jgi:hypothetical protein
VPLISRPARGAGSGSHLPEQACFEEADDSDGPPPPPNSGRQWYCTGPRLKKELRQARWFAAQDCPEGYRPAVQCLPVGDPCVLMRARRAVLSEVHFRRILKKYATYYNALRTHRSLNKDAPIHRAIRRRAASYRRPALFSVFETIRPKGLDHRASLVRVASLETGFAFQSAIEESETPASTSRHTSFGERFLFDQKLASFDERFAGADISIAEPEEGASNVLNYARLPSPGSMPTGLTYRRWRAAPLRRGCRLVCRAACRRGNAQFDTERGVDMACAPIGQRGLHFLPRNSA